MTLGGYKPGELFRRAMLILPTNPSRNDTESQGNSLEAEIEHSPDDDQLIGKRLEQNES